MVCFNKSFDCIMNVNKKGKAVEIGRWIKLFPS